MSSFRKDEMFEDHETPPNKVLELDLPVEFDGAVGVVSVEALSQCINILLSPDDASAEQMNLYSFHLDELYTEQRDMEEHNNLQAKQYSTYFEDNGLPFHLDFGYPIASPYSEANPELVDLDGDIEEQISTLTLRCDMQMFCSEYTQEIVEMERNLGVKSSLKGDYQVSRAKERYLTALACLGDQGKMTLSDRRMCTCLFKDILYVWNRYAEAAFNPTVPTVAFQHDYVIESIQAAVEATCQGKTPVVQSKPRKDFSEPKEVENDFDQLLVAMKQKSPSFLSTFPELLSLLTQVQLFCQDRERLQTLPSHMDVASKLREVAEEEASYKERCTRMMKMLLTESEQNAPACQNPGDRSAERTADHHGSWNEEPTTGDHVHKDLPEGFDGDNWDDKDDWAYADSTRDEVKSNVKGHWLITNMLLKDDLPQENSSEVLHQLWTSAQRKVDTFIQLLLVHEIALDNKTMVCILEVGLEEATEFPVKDNQSSWPYVKLATRMQLVRWEVGDFKQQLQSRRFQGSLRRRHTLLVPVLERLFFIQSLISSQREAADQRPDQPSANEHAQSSHTPSDSLSIMEEGAIGGCSV